MISHKVIADLINEVDQSDKGADQARQIWDFLSKYNLETLVEKSIRVLELRQREDSNFETLIVRSHQAKIDERVITNIKKALVVDPKALIRIEVDPQVKAGFIASYRGKMFDARLESLARKMSKTLKENFEN